MQKPLPKFGSSVFTKLLLVLLTAGVLINIAVYVGFEAMGHHFDPKLHEVVRQFATYLMNDLGPDPDLKKAQALSSRTGIRIRIESGHWSWSSSPNIPKISELPKGLPKDLNDGGPPGPPPFGFIHFGHREHHEPFMVFDYPLKRGPGQLVLMPPEHSLDSHPNFMLLGLLIVLVVSILLCTYLLIRWILSPIQSLSHAVREISSGRLDYQVPKTGDDELGRLAEAFNNMVMRIKEMIFTKQHLLVDMSHELRSPLTRAMVGLELLDQSDIVGRVQDDLHEMDRMIQELLESARLDSGHGVLEKEPTDVVKFIGQIVSLYSAVRRPVQILQGPTSATIALDQKRFKSVITNLIENALKYSDEKMVDILIESEEKEVRISVTDHGRGIPESEIDRVFEPFYRVDKSRNRKTGGFGLGLSLCKKIVAAHGGSLSLVSTLNVGTTVHISFPKK